MNVLFLSPHFPPQFWFFCQALRAQGVTTLGLGDVPHSSLPHPVQGALDGYLAVSSLADFVHHYDDVLRGVAYLISQHGRIDRIDSLNEFWLPLEARLREDFNVPGPRPSDLARNRSKTGMAEIFTGAGIPFPTGRRVEGPEEVRAFSLQHGFPLVLKPDIGVGAANTWRVDNAQQLEASLPQVQPGYRVERFEHGTLVSYDGLCDREGRIVFETSHVYSSGVMDIVNRGLDVFYYSRRELPPALVELGRKAVRAFGIQERFFHIEFFERPDGSLCALEINVRPPGGFTTDMMNYACDFDIYGLWAKVITGQDLSDFQYQRRYHVAHASRRHGRDYRVQSSQLRGQLGERLLLDREVPKVLSGAMGNHLYMLRSPQLPPLLEAIHLVMDPP